MTEGRDPTTEVLFPGGDTPSWLSAEELLLLTFALDFFGGPLSRFLLAGLGEEGVGRRWRFTITYVSGGLPAERQMEAISLEPARGPALFPRRKDPLMLIAFLKLLLSGGEPSSHELTYDRAQVLNLLGWEDTDEAWRDIDEAVERYTLMTFRWAIGRIELACNGLSSYTAKESIISGYKTIKEEGPDGQTMRVLNCLSFSQQFIEHLKLRSLFKIDWDGVDSICRVIER